MGKVDGEDYIQSVYIRADEGNVTSYVTVIEAEKRKQSTKEIAELFREQLTDIPDAEEINITYTINDGGPDLSFGVRADDQQLRWVRSTSRIFFAPCPVFMTFETIW
ncbi:MAG: hypothetical protein R3C40_03420 [Parvularculaceae bacterium]